MAEPSIRPTPEETEREAAYLRLWMFEKSAEMLSHLAAENVRMRDHLGRIKRGCESVLLDAGIKNSPVSCDVLQAVLNDARSGLGGANA